MIEFKSSVKTPAGKTIYSGGGNIVPSASQEISDILKRNINIKMQRLMGDFLHQFITKGKTQFIKMFVEFAEKEMKRRNQLGTGKTLRQLKSAKGLFSFKRSVKPVIGVTLQINEKSAKDLVKAKAENYDLSLQIPGSNEQDGQNDNDSSEVNPDTITPDDLFTDKE